jgi:hypothetical protein
LMGALLLLPLIINVFIVDFCFNVNAKDIISVLLLMDVFLITISLKPLYSLFVKQEMIDPKKLVHSYSYDGERKGWLKVFAIVAVLVFAYIPNNQLREMGKPNAMEGAWHASLVNNFSDSIPEKNKLLNLKLFVEGNTATIKKTYQYQDFAIAFDSIDQSKISLASGRDSLGINKVVAHYRFINQDSLLMAGREGTDSIIWIFQRTHR